MSTVSGTASHDGPGSFAWWRVTVCTVGADGTVLRGYDLSPDESGVESGDSWTFETEASDDAAVEAWVFADHATLVE